MLDPQLSARDQVIVDIDRMLARGTGVLLRAPAGVGKSAILRYLVARAEAAGEQPLVLTGSVLGARVPLGAFLPVVEAEAAELASDGGEGGDLGLLRIASLARERAGRASTVVVDDAHLLDPSSAGLIHQLASAGTTLVLALRSGETVPPAVSALWTGELVEIVEVAPFTPAETLSVLESLFAEPVDTGLGREVFEASAGNALFIRELVRSGVEHGAIALRRGVWVARAALPVADSLAAMLRAQLTVLDDELRHAVDLVAVADSLRLEAALRLVPREVLERAEEAGLLRSEAGPSVVLRLGHPLYRDAALGRMSSLRRSRLYDELSGALDDDAQTDAERVSLARWSLELGTERPAGEWLAHAGMVQSTDTVLAERFLRAGVAASGGIPALLGLANLLTHDHRVDEAEAIFADLAAADLPPEYRIALVATRAFLLAMPANRPEDALAIVEDGIAALGPSPDLLAALAISHWRAGHVTEAIELAIRVAQDPDASIPTAANAALTACSAMIYGLRWERFDEITARMKELVPLAAAVMPEGPESALLVASSRATMPIADVDEAGRVSMIGYLRALHDGNDGVRAQFAMLHGANRLIAGDVREALRFLQEAHAGSGVWTPTTLPWLRRHLIDALVAGGKPTEAKRLLELLGSGPIAGLYRLDVALARAAVLASDGEREAAIESLRLATPQAEAEGQRLRGNEVWYARLRMGDRSAAQGVAARFARDPSPQSAAIIEHARALGEDDPAALEAASGALADAGLLLFACEAQAQAVASYRRAGLPGTFAVERLARLVAGCPGLDSPLIRDELRGALTSREAEVSALAAAGASDREISAALGITLRTVQTHLTRVYAKLGIRSRAQLREQLAPQPERARLP